MALGTKAGLRRLEFFSPPKGSAWTQVVVSPGYAWSMRLCPEMGFLG